MTTAYGTFAYGAAGGVLAMAVVYFAGIGLRRPAGPGRPSMLAFMAASAVGALSAWNLLVMQTSPTIETYAPHFQVFGFIGLAGVVTTVALVATWTDTMSRWGIALFGMASAVVAVFQLVLPDGLLIGEITGLRAVELLGEGFVVQEGPQSPWRPVLDAYLIGTFVLIVATLVGHYRRGARRDTTLVTIGLVILIAFNAFDSLVDEGLVDTAYLSPFGSVFIAVAGAILVSGRTSRAERQLARHASELEQTVVERTAALVAANDDLAAQLDLELRTVRRLEMLTAQFESSNQVSGPGIDLDETTEVLRSMLATLGRLLDAARVEFRLDRLDGVSESKVLPESIVWLDDGDVADDAAARDVFSAECPTTEPVVIEGRELGSIEIAPRPPASFGAEERRYLRLTSKHVAGFVKRIELNELIAADAVDIERHRIARDLHDSVTQRLYSVAFLADAAQRQIANEPALVDDTLVRIRSLLRTSLSELRILLFELQPQSLDAARLPQLVEQLVDTVGTGADMRVEADVEPIPPLPRDAKLGLYRLAQEALSNAVRHSGSGDVTVSVSHDCGVTTLTVRDSGDGFDPGAVERGNGLDNLEQRAASVGADLVIDSRVGDGTDVVIRWPADGVAP